MQYVGLPLTVTDEFLNDESLYTIAPLKILKKCKDMSEAKGEIAGLISKWIEVKKSKELVDKMLGERLESELLTY